MKRLLSISILVLTVLACKPNIERPIPEEALKNFILDLRIQEGIVRQYPIGKRDSMRRIWHAEVLDIHHISDEQYADIMFYLENHPDEYFEMEEEIQERLKKIKDRDED